jgi:hypothetical protein
MPKVIHEETMCCGRQRCPTVRVLEDGSVEISDDDAERGSAGTIKIRAEAVNRLAELLLTKVK